MRPLVFARRCSVGAAIVAGMELLPCLPAFAQEPLFPVSTCVEAPASVANSSRRRSGSSTDCDDDTRRDQAIRRARSNASDAMAPQCTALISAQERQQVCAARGLTPKPANQPASMTGLVAVPGSPDGGIDDARPIAGTSVCTVARDLAGESTSETLPAQWGGLGDCPVFRFPFWTSEQRVRFTARARARCGVQCL